MAAGAEIRVGVALPAQKEPRDSDVPPQTDEARILPFEKRTTTRPRISIPPWRGKQHENEHETPPRERHLTLISVNGELASPSPTSRTSPQTAQGKRFRIPNFIRTTRQRIRNRSHHRTTPQPTEPFVGPFGPRPGTPDYVYIIGKQDVLGHAREAASETMRTWYHSSPEEQQQAAGRPTTGRRGGKKGRMRTFLSKSILHMFEENHRQKLTKQAADLYIANNNVHAALEAPQIRKGLTVRDGDHKRVEHQADQDAKAEQVRIQYTNGVNFGKQQIGETIVPLNKNGPLYQAIVSNIIEPIAVRGETMTRQDVEREVLAIVDQHKADRQVERIFGKRGKEKPYHMIATDLLNLAETQHTTHGPAYQAHTRTISDDIDIVFANLQSGARSAIPDSWVDKLVKGSQTKLKAVISPASVAVSGAVGIALAQRLPGSIVRATDKANYFLQHVDTAIIPAYLWVPAAVAGVIAGVRHRHELNVDRELHNRQEANGEVAAPTVPVVPARTRQRWREYRQRQTDKRRQFMAEHTHHLDATADMLVHGIVTGTSPTPGLNTLRTDYMNTASEENRTALLDRISHILALRNISDRQRKDTIRSTQATTIDQGDLLLTQELTQSLDALITTYGNDETRLALHSRIATHEQKLQRSIDATDRSFRGKALRKSATVGAIAATTALSIGEAMRFAIMYGSEAWHRIFGKTATGIDTQQPRFAEQLAAGEAVNIDGVTVQKAPDGQIRINGEQPIPELRLAGEQLVTHADVSKALAAQLEQRGLNVRAAFPDTAPFLDIGLPDNIQVQIPQGTWLRTEGDSVELWSNEEQASIKLADNIRFDPETGEVTTITYESPLVEARTETIPGIPQRVPINPQAFTATYAYAPTGGIEWAANNTRASDFNEFRLDNKKVGDHAVQWDISRMTEDGSWQRGNHPEVVDIPERINDNNIYWTVQVPGVQPDAPGGYRNPISIHANTPGGGLLLNQDAPASSMVDIKMGGQHIQVAEREMAQFVFARDLGAFTSNSDLTDFEHKFNVKVSASTFTQNEQGEDILMYLATHDGTGTPAVVGEEAPEPIERTIIEGATVIDLLPTSDIPGETPLPYEPLDVGVPVPISPRNALGQTSPVAERTGAHILPRLLPPVAGPSPVPHHPTPSPQPGPIIQHETIVAHNEQVQRRMMAFLTNPELHALSNNDLLLHPSLLTRARRIFRQAFPNHDTDIDTLVRLYTAYQENAMPEASDTQWDKGFIAFSSAYLTLNSSEYTNHNAPLPIAS